ncbi:MULTISPECIES: hypothetical protein [Streptacidiphilus]|uniref:Lipoprotein n=1 Tax=Streptacidiphilus cavernicola TaxID=3342716 RepID=A0ABV6UM48_9ACTN|nr:hypothetical protein [Streptacidiphilus jeojiense]
MFKMRAMPTIIAAVSGGALLVGGCAAAAAAPATPAARATPAAQAARTTPAPAAAHGGAVHLIDYSVDSDGPKSSVLLTGAIGDYGQAVTVHPDGTVDPDHTSQMQLGLRHGSFRLDIAQLDKKIIKAYDPWPHNAATCSGSISFTVPTPVVPGSGTGSYRGISGTFDLTVTIDEVDTTVPACDGTSGFLSQIILLTGNGHVALH